MKKILWEQKNYPISSIRPRHLQQPRTISFGSQKERPPLRQGIQEVVNAHGEQ